MQDTVDQAHGAVRAPSPASTGTRAGQHMWWPAPGTVARALSASGTRLIRW
jgi:hypothetical protein